MKLESLNETIFENIESSNGKFSKHFHDTYTIGLTHDGKFQSINQNQTTLSYKNSTRIINPGEVHYGNSDSWKYTNFYPKIELLAQIHEQVYFEKKIPIFTKHIIEDMTLYHLLLNFFLSAYENNDKLLMESNLINAMSYLIKNYTDTTRDYSGLFDDKLIVKNSIEYIKDLLDTNISLEELAMNSNLSKYHFLRVFKKQMGLTPHQYILTQRVHKAKELILSGEKLSHIPFSVGFNDQSHFIRNFRKIYGYSPKELQKESNFILYK
ncbi:helix-turn-helix transcriptional regulator [Poseidonibacter lekithochrous]|uniref:helix-turn-helix transcriptional regulator n=1 Tax=Poseidonibacter lekithochrous TaxID=1904463 RepID=UPI0008FC6AD2|nr:AraC family transcriptional regulator [Poseidonibacter lekithochrous]QKJ22153.1 transcriptional regulator, AraC family [Poseidonibacter lekithochrous]